MDKRGAIKTYINKLRDNNEIGFLLRFLDTINHEGENE